MFQRSGADYLVAIGGGSPQDTCKAIGIIHANPEFADVRSLEGLSPTRNPGGTDHGHSDHRRNRGGSDH